MRNHKGFESYTWVTADGRSYTVRPGEDGVTQADIQALYDADRRDGNNARAARRHQVSLDAIEKETAGKAALFADDLDIEGDILERICLLWQFEQLRAALETLPTHQRKLLHQVYVEGLSFREIARREGTFHNNIRYRLAGVMAQLKKHF